MFQLCQARLGTLLLENLEEAFRSHSTAVIDRLSAGSPDDRLQKFVQQWSQFKDALQRISGVLLYFKNYVVITHRKSIQQLGEHIFCSTIFGDAATSNGLLSSAKTAASQPFSSDVLKVYASVLQQLEGGLWREPFVQTPYVSYLVDAYSSESEVKCAALPVIHYLRWVRAAVEKERQKSEQILGPTFVKDVESAMYDVLVRSYQNYILLSDTGLRAMLASWDMAAIQLVVDVFVDTDGIDKVFDVTVSEIKKKWATLVGDTSQSLPISIVPRVSELVGQTKSLAALFGNESNSPMLRCLHDSINASPTFIDTLSAYYDDQIRQANKLDVERMCSHVIELFQIIRDKDLFEVSFRNHLAARLIHDKQHTIETEQHFISMLKNECGTGLVSRVERMITDIQSGEEIHSRLMRDMASRNATLPLDLHVAILTSGFWPQYTNSSLSLPSSMKACIKTFQQFYSPRHNERKLSFQRNLGTVVFQLTNRDRTYSVSAPTPFVNTIQMLNIDQERTVEEVAQFSCLAMADIDAQVRVLKQNGLVVCLPETGRFMFNTSFQSSRHRIRISTGPAKAHKEPADRTEGQSVDFIRSQNIDAVILQVLKRRKALDHEVLCREVIASLQRVFTPTLPELKRRIEALIEKTYISRGSRSGLYVYSE